MGYNEDLITPLLLYSTNYTTSHSLAHCNIKESRNDDQQIITGSTREPKEPEICTQSRWNPTPEQMMALEEVYKSGMRSPTTQKIQEIASKLQKYGRIEGKNVFYWFQNHKSRERLKRRRPDQQERFDFNNVHEEAPLRKDNVVNSGNKDSSVLRRRGDHRVIHTKNYFSSSPTHPKNNNIDDKKMEEYERRLVEVKEDTWKNQIDNYHLIVTSKRSQEAEHQYNLNEEEEEEEEEETRTNRTLDLFPVKENQEKTVFAEKNTKPNQLCYYYYEFMPLMN